MRHIIPVSGKDSLATALVQMTREPDLPYELFFNDVGCELPETYAWLDKVEKKLNIPVHRVGKSLIDVIYKEGMLPSPLIRFCTREAKIEPMEKYIGSDYATIYFGIRADEDRTGYKEGKHNIIPRYPLKEIGITLPLVYQIVKKANLQPPTFFWKRLYDTVLFKMQKEYNAGLKIFSPPEKLIESLPEWIFDSLFAWRSRSNCYSCFYQRQYEWVGLLEHHPELFDKAEEIEKDIGNADRRETPYTWVAGRPLSLVRKDKDRVFLMRVADVRKIIRKRIMSRDVPDELSITSCGLFCGK